MTMADSRLHDQTIESKLCDRIVTLEAELKAARETIADKQAWIERIVKNAAEEANRQTVELAAAKDSAEGYYALFLQDAEARTKEIEDLKARLVEVEIQRNYEVSWKEANAAQAAKLVETVEALKARADSLQDECRAQLKELRNWRNATGCEQPAQAQASVAALADICEEAQRTLGEQFTSPTQAVYKLAHKYSAANARADAAEKKLAKAVDLLDRSRANAGNLLVRMEAAEAEAARLRGVLQKVEAWFAGEDGPVYYRWENGDIGDFDEVVWDWEETLEWARDLKMPLGAYEEYPSVVLYREIYAALRGAEEEGNQ